MAITQFAHDFHERMFPGYQSDFLRTDPEFIERFDNFAFDEVIHQAELDDPTRFMVILAMLLGCQGIDEFTAMLPAALNFGLEAVKIKEVVYQAVAYLGIGRVFPFLKATNRALEDAGISLPLEPQTTTNSDEASRLRSGIEAQVGIFGENMVNFWQSGPQDSQHINRWLTSNCFGDYYTRKGLSAKERELITFCFLAAQGGAEPQLVSHAGANLRIGNDKDFLIPVISQGIPFIGYPRSLNALRCLRQAAQDAQGEQGEQDGAKSTSNPTNK
ncbi:carboxymuconolactone decarboxylase [Bombiscardovia apis]|uniref:Carboxymuconolactone decarboxylase n=2 Tax=Bombiscardovia apis TaxID=2932182 RepID=A0ABN6SG28_9BIFI|nr:carboxymuconolactone decarboxylase family protein [Bombiscardovia apis]BDR54211.1 carboxymuconolactone decarboxylase [Bombiscardovia apis]